MPFSFQVTDIVYKDQVQVSSNPPGPDDVKIYTDVVDDKLLQQEIRKNGSWSEKQALLKRYHGQILLFGRDDSPEHRTVTVRLKYEPFLFLEVQPNWTDHDFQRIVQYITSKIHIPRQSVTYTKEARHRAWGYHPHPKDPTKPAKFAVLRMRFPSEVSMRNAYWLLQKNEIPAQVRLSMTRFRVWEGNPTFIDVRNKFSDESGIMPFSWVTVPEQCTPTLQRASRASVEFFLDDWHVLQVQRDRVDMVPLRRLSFDLECFSHDGAMPDPHDPADTIIGIGNTVAEMEAPQSTWKRVYHCLRETLIPPDYQGPEVKLCIYTTELDLLRGWRDFVIQEDPDVLLGYNINKFDINYLQVRMEPHCVDRADRFFFLSRLWAEHTPAVSKSFDSSAYGSRDSVTWDLEGRVVLDLLEVIRREHKLSMYKLDAVAEHFLDRHKIDLPKNDLFRYFQGTPEQRGQIAVYCARDCDLPLELEEHLCTMMNLAQMASVTCTNVSDLIHRGQQFKTINQMALEFHAMDYMLNDPPEEELSNTEDYEGATVLEPKLGYYSDPITCNDFVSLYPSIMRNQNLCYSTQIIDPKHNNLPGVEYNRIRVKSNVEHAFVKNVPGVLPRILAQLLTHRKKEKKLMATSTTEKDRKVHNGRQLALKISCNSIYGFTGTGAKGKYPSRRISESVTATGRVMIQQTKAVAEGPEFPGSVVIYGDTDSVMTKFGLTEEERKTDPLAACWAKGVKLAKVMSQTFGFAVELDMEKVYDGYLLLKKKRYAGLAVTCLGKPPKMDVKGIEMVRRDCAPFVKRCQEQSLRVLLYEKDVNQAKQIVGAAMDGLVNNTLPFEDYILTCEMKRSYASDNMLQVQVAKKMRERNPGSEPASGDRMQFVIIENEFSVKYLKGEDAEYAKTHQIPLDRHYYMEKQMQRPIMDVLQAFVAEPEKVFHVALNELSRQKRGVKRLSDYNQIQFTAPLSFEHMLLAQKDEVVPQRATSLQKKDKAVKKVCRRPPPSHSVQSLSFLSKPQVPLPS